MRAYLVTALAALALATACATTRTQHAVGDEHITDNTAARTTGVRHEAPVVEMEFGAPPAAEDPSGRQSTGALPRHGPLHRLTIRGAVDSSYGSEFVEGWASVAHATDDTSRTATPELPKVPVGCALAGSLWLYVVAAVALGGGVPLLAWARRAIAAFRGRSP